MLRRQVSGLDSVSSMNRMLFSTSMQLLRSSCRRVAFPHSRHSLGERLLRWLVLPAVLSVSNLAALESIQWQLPAQHADFAPALPLRCNISGAQPARFPLENSRLHYTCKIRPVLVLSIAVYRSPSSCNQWVRVSMVAS